MIWGWGKSGRYLLLTDPASPPSAPGPLNFSSAPFLQSSTVEFVDVVINLYNSFLVVSDSAVSDDQKFVYAWGGQDFFDEFASVEVPTLLFSTTTTMGSLQCGMYHCVILEKGSPLDLTGRALGFGRNSGGGSNYRFREILDFDFSPPVVIRESNVSLINGNSWLTRMVVVNPETQISEVVVLGQNHGYLGCWNESNENVHAETYRSVFATGSEPTDSISFVGGDSHVRYFGEATFVVQNGGRIVSGCGKTSSFLPGIEQGVMEYVDITEPFFGSWGSEDEWFIVSLFCEQSRCLAIVANGSSSSLLESQWIVSWGGNSFAATGRSFLGDGWKVPGFVHRGDVGADEYVLQVTASPQFAMFLTNLGRAYAFGEHNSDSCAFGNLMDPVPTKYVVDPMRILPNVTGTISYMPASSPDDAYLVLSTSVRCDGLFPTHPHACSGFGHCVRDDECDCDRFHTGAFCSEIPVCFDVRGAEEGVCSGNGLCTTDPVPCDCFDGWMDVICSQIDCFGFGSRDPEVCSGAGECSAPGNCICESDYYSYNCSEHIGSATFGDADRLTISVVWETSLPSLGNLRDRIFDCEEVTVNDTFWVSTNCRFETLYDSSSSVATGTITSVLVITIYSPEIRDTLRVGMVIGLLPLSPAESVTWRAIREFETSSVSFPYVFVVVPVVVLSSIVAVILVTVVVFGCFAARKSQTQRKQLARFSELRDVDLLIAEQKAEKESGLDKLKINKSLFAIEYESVELLQKIGQGGSGANIFLAKWNEEVVAFKVFRVSEQDLELIERELSLMLSLRHPFILSAFGACVNPPRIGIVMEYCSGGDLEKVVSHTVPNGMNWTRKLRLLREIASAMLYLHRRKIIHRDLKLQNVLLTREDSTRVMDFGLSRALQEEGHSGGMTRRIGTPNYMAPELFSGSYGFKVDVYAFSIVMYELLAETTKPFGQSQEAVLYRVSTDPTFRPLVDLEELSKRNRGASEDLEWFVELMRRSWSHEPSDRPGFEEILDVLLEHSPSDQENGLAKKSPSLVQATADVVDVADWKVEAHRLQKRVEYLELELRRANDDLRRKNEELLQARGN